MNWWINIVFIICAYLVGALPHLQLVARLKKIELTGDYHACLLQKGGIPLAGLGIAGEFIKGAIPILIGRMLGFDINILAAAGVATVCGQMWPVFRGFDGEKGNSISLTMSLSLAYQPVLFALIPVVLSLSIRTLNRLSRKNKKTAPVWGGPVSYSMPIGMFIAFLVLPISSWLLKMPAGVTLGFCALFVLITLRRLTAGLSSDLQQSTDYMKILSSRLWLDRGISKYR